MAKSSLFLCFILLCGVHQELSCASQNRAIIAVPYLPQNIYPYATSPLSLSYAHLFFDPLVRWGADGKLEKRLLKGWQQIKPTVVRFYLKKNIYFHSGNLLTSDDVIWSYRQIKQKSKFKLFILEITKITRVDAYSFDIDSTLSVAELLDYLTNFFVVDKKFYQHLQKRKPPFPEISHITALTPIVSGTGPYKLKTFNANLALNIIRNKNYWDVKAGSLDLQFLKIKSQRARIYALFFGDVDMSYAVLKKQIKSIQMEKNKKLVTIRSSRALYLSLSAQHTSFLQEKLVRKIISLTINQKGMLTNIVQGFGEEKPLLTARSINKGNEYNVQKAQKLLLQIKMPKQLTLLSFKNEKVDHSDVLQALKNMFKSIGINLLISQISSEEEWLETMDKYDLTLSAWQTSLRDPKNIYKSLFLNSPLTPYLEPLYTEQKILNRSDFFNKLLQEQRIIVLFSVDERWGVDKKYAFKNIFSINVIPYWQDLRLKNKR